MKASARGMAILAIVGIAGLLIAGLSVHMLKNAVATDPNWRSPAFQIRDQVHQSFSFFEPIADAELGFVLPPNLQQTVTTGDFTFVRVTDAYGFPNSGEWPGRADIVVTGDSLLIGDGVGVDGAFVSLVGESLRDQTVVNLGNPGAGLERQRLIYGRYGAPLAPTVVIATLFTAADLSNDRHFFAWQRDPLGMEYNEFRVSYAGRVDPPGELEKRFDSRPVYSWVQSVIEPRLWGSRRVLHRRRMPDGQEIFFDHKVVKAAKSELSADDPDLVALSSSLDRFREQVTSQGAVFAVILIPSKEEVFAIGQPPPPNSPIARVKALLDVKGIPYLDLYPIIAASAEHATPYFQRDIHLNRYGNQVVAEAVAAWYDRAIKPEVPAVAGR